MKFLFFKDPYWLPGGEGVGRQGLRAEVGSSPSAAPTAQAGAGWVAEVKGPPWDGKREEPVSPALDPQDPQLAGPAGVAAAQSGEAGVKRHRLAEIRGLQDCG